MRWVFLAALLAFEGLAVSTRFDAAPLLGGSQWWDRILGHAGVVIPLLTYVAAALVLFGSAPAWSGAGRVPWAALAAHRWRRYLVAHLLAFGIFVHLTGMVFGDAGGGAVWVAAWLACGALAAALWSATMLPGAIVWPLLRDGRYVLVAATVLGAGAFAAAQTTDRWWQPLGYLTLRVAEAVLGAFGVPTLVRPDELVIGTPAFLVEIRPECSGYQGIGLLWVFLAGYFWLFRRTLRFPQVLLLVPLGTVVVWLANAVRIAALIAVGTWVSEDVAVGGFHHNAGALLFCAVALGLVALAQRAPLFSRAAVARMTEAANATGAYLVPLLVLVAVSALAGAVSAGDVDRLYPLRVVAVGAALWVSRAHYGPLRARWSWTAVATGALAYGAWLALVPIEPEAGAALREGLVAMPAAGAVAWVAFRVVGSIVVIPAAEELAFRGYLLRRLVAADFERVAVAPTSWVAVAVSSVLFGAMHDAVLAGTVVGVLYALVLRRRGALADAVIAHATTNALVAGHVLLGGAWSLWA
ncbi:MAG: exosortase E/protease, VPEID-CTERM system [Candidatus Binatia bacterium]